ncbi:MAG: GTP-binding protein [Nitrospira sp.]|nr:MAG: GTP-binding protein [Nitrospira sp.]
MIQKKICLLGGFAVGKTSLIRRFVTDAFSEQYHTTIGVTIEKKTLLVDDRDVTLMIWDLYGEDDFQKMRESYLRGSSGYILVADGMRRSTLDTAEALHQLAQSTLGPVPFVLIVNKADQRKEWEIDEPTLARLRDKGWLVFTGSAKTGDGVPELFLRLTHIMLEAA